MIKLLDGEEVSDIEYLRRIVLLLQEKGHMVEASTVDEIIGRIVGPGGGQRG